jgi:multisubunit Na+/H+ antiporter MnhF subunit
MTTVATITTPTYSSGVAGLNGVIMIVFAAMIIFGILKQMSSAA